MVSADKGHRKTFAALFTKRSESKSRGKHGWERLLVTGDKKNAKAATVLWDTTVFSRGGRSNAQQLVVWIETGGFLPLSNGSNIRFDGMRVEEVEEISLRK